MKVVKGGGGYGRRICKEGAVCGGRRLVDFVGLLLYPAAAMAGLLADHGKEAARNAVPPRRGSYMV